MACLTRCKIYPAAFRVVKQELFLVLRGAGRLTHIDHDGGSGGQPGGQLGLGLFSPGITYGELAAAIAIAHPHPDGSLTVMEVRPGGIT